MLQLFINVIKYLFVKYFCNSPLLRYKMTLLTSTSVYVDSQFQSHAFLYLLYIA